MNIEEFISRYNEVFEGDPWYGISLCDALHQIPLEFWDRKPEGAAHSVTEYVWHLIDWKKFVIEKVKENKEYTIIMNSSQDWREHVSVNTKDDFNEILGELRRVQQSLCELIVSKEESWFEKRTVGRDYINQYMLEGILQHDIYHLGQLNLIYSQLKLIK
ncbi:DinB family protein [Aquimarina sp. 2201CG1-2-11]|uniref:DinB family protein n=1 Tax=Aquimarina discodermiae TaxID=3231043 RepID=UPI0034623EBA